MKRLLFILVVLMICCLTSCLSGGNHNSETYDRQDVAAVIANHDTSVLYFMTSWCQAGQSDFENNLKPYLGNASDTKAIIIVCIGELEEVMGLKGLNDNVFLFSKASRQGFFDKVFINSECKELLKDYKRVNYVPVRLVCNGKGEILNWDTDEESSRTYGSIYPYLIAVNER